MNIEQLAVYFIVVHATLGGMALLAGLLAIIFKKGSRNHVLAGRVFYWSMLASALLGMLVSIWPGHHSAFLFSIGVFSSYLLIGGYRATRFKRSDVDLRVDRVVAWIMFVVGVLMISYPVYSTGNPNIVLSVFGAIGVIFAVRDHISFRQPSELRKTWMQWHLGKMMGGYIAAVTAFVVVNQLIPGLYGWLGPTVLGTGFIVILVKKGEVVETAKCKTSQW